jgi:molybdopterin-containing oxidoreductase family iron-sulfur binding subunit
VIDRDSVRKAIDGKRGQRYWRSLAELAETPEFLDYLNAEWPRLARLWDSSVDRRSILRLMGASLVLAGLSGCDEAPDKIIPYVRQPKDVVPGVPRYFATAVSRDGYGHGVLGETHEGRPTKIEGNPDHPINRGATDVFDQAALLGLYDPDRSSAVRQKGIVDSYDGFLGALTSRRESWGKAGGTGMALLTGRISSPTLLDRIAALKKQYPGLRWYRYDAIDRSAESAAARLSFGQAVETRYRFADARVVLALDGDFLGLIEPGQLAYARDFMAGRRPHPDRPPTRLYVVESTPGLAGAAADHVLRIPAWRVEPVARALARRLGIDIGAGADVDGAEARWLDAVAKDLNRNQGAAPVITGANQPASVHALVHVINDRLKNAGSSVEFHEPIAPEADAGIDALASDIAAGRVDMLITLDGNPVYTAPADLDLGRRIATHVRLHIHWGLYDDETAQKAHWHVPATHELESWGDVRALDGTVTIQQPLIMPLYGGVSALELLAAVMGDYGSSAHDAVRGYWRGRHSGGDFETFWRGALKKGVIDGTAAKKAHPKLRNDLLPALARQQPGRPSQGVEIRFRPDDSAWDGRFANNPWLQELPRPLTKIVWTNAAMVGPGFARKWDIENGRMIRIHYGGRSVDAPVWILPGQPDDSIALTLGYGRPMAGRVGSDLGYDAYAVRDLGHRWFAAGAEIQPLGETTRIVTTQHHHAIEGRALVRSASWDEYRADPNFATRGHEAPRISLYPEPDPEHRTPGKDGWTPYAWGMVIDFSACIGCNACIIACQAENNIPVVGAEQVERGREMHWLRVDRYYAGDPSDPATVFQPVPCMQCENAPCEYVCPVEATQHSSEGLNEMVYNRCIGTRYCSQNCPYKVRRFNWFDFTSSDADYPARKAAQNPEVTIRSRGVMEKCTYCVQRIDRARIRADREGRTIAAGEVTTACQDACPTQAIVFGDIENPDSEVRTLKQSPRNYGMLAELNVRPRTTYLAGVSNPNSEIENRDDAVFFERKRK